MLLFLVVSCDHKPKGVLPNRLLSEQEMTDIMTDVQIIEAELNYRKTEEKDSLTEKLDFRALSRSYYDQLFEHYGITDSIFSENLQYYSKFPGRLEVIMDSVTQRLTKAQSQLEPKQ